MTTANGTLTASTIVGDYDSSQTTLLLPPAYAKQFPIDYLAEIDVIGRVLQVELVAPGRKGKVRRYRIVRHHGSYRLSIPRWWLRDNNAKRGDQALFEWTPGDRYARISLVKGQAHAAI